MQVDIVIPCFRVSGQVANVVVRALALHQVRNIIVVDDGCPEHSGQVVRDRFSGEPRVMLIEHETNQGVGGAVLSGYAHAFADGADVVVKVDGDGQMDPQLVPLLSAPVMQGKADYAKGNRFFYPRHLSGMPRSRLFGNATLSLINKFSSGYWSVMDPTNGYTALHRAAYRQLDTERLDRGYFFESDMLFQLGIANAVVVDVPMLPVYRNETSSMNISKVAIQFPGKYLNRFLKRIAFKYFVREFNIASLEIMFGIPAMIAGLTYGFYHWFGREFIGRSTPPGTVMIVGLLILMGFQLLLSAVNYDITHEPNIPLSQSNPTVP
ncbi:MAG TPA: glycosyltransferase family 2 protein [Burkholderiales bacterium]|nr:glycosyltransferase family 2 protein [Burkholderiales bacterium]